LTSPLLFYIFEQGVKDTGGRSMLSEDFKRRIDNTTDLKKLKDEIGVMTQIMFESDDKSVKGEMKEKIAYVKERVRGLEQG
jgi:hypothetical protein